MSDQQETAPDAHPAFSGPPAAGDDSAVKITAAEFRRLQALEAEFAAFKAQHTSEIEASAAKLAEFEKTIGSKDEQLSKLQAAAGGIEQALADQRTGFESQLTQYANSYQAMRDMFMHEKLSNAAAAALAGQAWSGATPETQAKIAAKGRAELEAMLVAEEVNGKVQVRGKDGRPVADVARDLVKAPEFQPFLAPKSRGGSGTDGTRPAGTGQSPNPPNPDGNPHPLGSYEWGVWNWKHHQEAQTKLRVRPKQQ